MPREKGKERKFHGQYVKLDRHVMNSVRRKFTQPCNRIPRKKKKLYKKLWEKRIGSPIRIIRKSINKNYTGVEFPMGWEPKVWGCEIQILKPQNTEV